MCATKTTIMPILTIVCLLSHNVTKSSWKKKLVENGSSFLAIGCGAVALGVKLIQDGMYKEEEKINSIIKKDLSDINDGYYFLLEDLKDESEKKINKSFSQYWKLITKLNENKNKKVETIRNDMINGINVLYKSVVSNKDFAAKALDKADYMDDDCPNRLSKFSISIRNAGIKIGFGGGFVSAGLLTIGYGIYKLLCKKPS